MEIYADILKSVADGKQKPTHIMYRANISWTRMKKHLRFLVAHDLLEEVQNREGLIYKLSAKGAAAQGYYRKLKNELYEKRKVPTAVYIRNK
jgi:predicted transcriptional regulator